MVIQCLAPTQAWINDHIINPATGNPRIFFRLDRSKCNPLWVNAFREIALPCGKCILCRKRRAWMIGMRAYHESKCHDRSCFVTLTVDDEHLEKIFPGARLTHRPFQLFFKRLRKATGLKLRYLMCGEYGEHTHRPHYHVIIFGWCPRDGYVDDRGVYHASRLLHDIWEYGNHRCDDINSNRIMYVAGYQLKDDANGEYRSYVKWSRRPGLGGDWFDRFWSDVYSYAVDRSTGDKIVRSNVIYNRSVLPFACRYYDQRLSLHDERRCDILRVTRRDHVGDDQSSEVVNQVALKGLRNKVELLNKRLADRTRDIV